LLIAKQGKGVEYNTLLNKIMGDYLNINSARAALSRTLKDLDALGLIRRRGDLIQLTNKGIAKVNMEMKNKLLLKVNTLIKEKRAEENPDEFVKLLSTLIERGKQDKDLLKLSKESSGFFILDISVLRKKVNSKAKHYAYLESVLGKHVAALKEMDFKDSVEITDFRVLKKFSAKQAKDSAIEEFPLASSDERLTSAISKKFGGELKGKNLFLGLGSLLGLLEFLQEQKEPVRASVFLHDVELKFSEKNARAIGPASKLRGLRR